MTQSTEIRDAIAAANEKFMAAVSRGDAAGLAALYTDNGQVLPPNSDFVRGRQAIQTFWQGIMDMGIKTATLEIVEVEDHGDTAIEVSTYTLQDEGGQVSGGELELESRAKSLPGGAHRLAVIAEYLEKPFHAVDAVEKYPPVLAVDPRRTGKHDVTRVLELLDLGGHIIHPRPIGRRA